MKLDVGPVASISAVVWTEWAHRVLGELRARSESSLALPTQVVDDLDSYVDQWSDTSVACNGSFRWETEIDPEELEHVTYAFYNLDARLRGQISRVETEPEPPEGRAFYLVMVRALLEALAQEDPTRAAFAAQLRPGWPSAVAAE